MVFISGKAIRETAGNNDPRPTVKVRLPIQSKRWFRAKLTGSRSFNMPQIVPVMPKGTLIRNTHCQDMAVKIPPMTGPSRKPAANAIWFTPRPNLKFAEFYEGSNLAKYKSQFDFECGKVSLNAPIAYQI